MSNKDTFKDKFRVINSGLFLDEEKYHLRSTIIKKEACLTINCRDAFEGYFRDTG